MKYIKYLGLLILLIFGIYVSVNNFLPINNLVHYNENSEAALKDNRLNSETSEKSKDISVNTPQVSVSNIASPVQLTIPRLNVEADIEIVGEDSQGRMDVPKNVNNVAWYRYGVKPGETGNAVIAGHLDTIKGAPAVFFKLSTLKNGDMIYITDQKGLEYQFKVVSVNSYPTRSFPLEEVFGSGSKPRLNLITCEGVYDSRAASYTNRTVVYSELVNM